MTTNLRTCKTNYSAAEMITTEFDMTDNKGRKIGHIAQINTVESTLTPEARSGYVIPSHLPLTFFEVRTNATRNGERYGAGQGGATYAATIEEAREVAKAKAEASRKSYTRKFEKVGA